MSSIDRIYKTIALSRWDNPPRLMINQFVAKIANEVSKGAWVLDAGAGECIYASAFSHCHYVSCDRAIGDPSWDYTRLSVLGDMAALPFRKESFDAILCTQALEHVNDPQPIIRQMAALLKPSGRLYLSVPFLGDPLHQEPYDFYRYTKYSLTFLLENAGLYPLDISSMGGLWFLLCCYFWWFFIVYDGSIKLVHAPKISLGMGRRIVRTIVLFSARFSAMLVITLGLTNAVSDKFTYGYTAVAEKQRL